MSSEDKLKRGYATPGEYRAYVDGNHDAIQVALNLLVPEWRLGRDAIELDRVRDFLVARLSDMARYVAEAQRLEMTPEGHYNQVELVAELAKSRAACGELIIERNIAVADLGVCQRNLAGRQLELENCRASLCQAEAAKNNALDRVAQFDRDSRQLGADRAQYKMDLDKLRVEFAKSEAAALSWADIAADSQRALAVLQETHAKCHEVYADKLIELSERGRKAMQAAIACLRRFHDDFDKRLAAIHELEGLLDNTPTMPEDIADLNILVETFNALGQ